MYKSLDYMKNFKGEKKMKKKIFLAITIVAMLVCLFAISVSAARVENYDAKYTLQTTESFTHYEKWYYNDGAKSVNKDFTSNNVALTFVDENGQPLTSVPMWEYDEEDGKYYSLVWYISAYEYTTEDGTYTDDKVGTQTYKIYKTAKYTLSKVRAVDLRYYTHEYGSKQAGVPGWETERKLIALEGIYLTNGTPNDTSDDIKLQDAEGIGRDKNNQGYFGWEAQFDATGDKIVVGNFRDCTFERDAYLNYGSSNTWSNAFHLQCIWYPDTVKYLSAGVNSVREVDLGDGIEIIACQILRDNKAVKEFIVPNSALYINHEAFRGTDLSKLTIGEGLIVHGGNPFLYTGGADITVLSKNLLNDTYTSNIVNLVANDKAVIYFDGSLQNAEKLYETILAQRGDTKYYNNVGYYDYTTTTERASTNELSIFYNYNTCEAFYRGQHTDVGNDCVFTCEKCDTYDGTMRDEPKHNYVTTIEYTNYVYVENYAGGTKTQKCQNEGCAHNLEPNKTTAKPIISEFKGFSTPVEGEGLTFGYVIDYEALEEYVAVNGKSVELGLVVAGKALLDGKAPLGENGNVANEKVVKISVVTWSNKAEDNADIAKYTGVDFKITGDWSEVMNEELYMAGYLSYGDGYKYLNAGGSSDTADYTTYYTIINQGK